VSSGSGGRASRTTESAVGGVVAAAVAQLTAESEPEREQAWSTLYELYTPPLLEYARRWNVRTAAAEDVVIDAWGKFYLRVHGGLDLEPGVVLSYLRRICRSILVDRARETRRTRSLDSEEGDAEVSPGSDAHGRSRAAPTPPDPPTEQELAALRRALLDRLRPADFALYGLIVAGTSREDIASQLGISRSAVDVRAFRLRDRLRRMEEALHLYRALQRDSDDPE
jgi:RNA polymerase sigma factor (sigma-70 family)